MSQGSCVVAAATTAGVLAGAYCVYHLYNEPKASKLPTTWKKVGTLDDMFIYPIKSCAGIQKTTAECTSLGLKDGWLRDRTLMVVDNKYRTVTARVFPKLLLVKPAITHSTLTLKCKDMEPLHLNLEEASIINSPGMCFCPHRYISKQTRLPHRQAESNDSATTRENIKTEIVETGAFIIKFSKAETAYLSDTIIQIYIHMVHLHNLVKLSNADKCEIVLRWVYNNKTIAAQSLREAYMRSIKYPVYDCGWEPQEWFSRFLNNSAADYGLVLFKDTTKKILKFQKTDTGAFVDDLPFNLINQASIDDLNTKLKGVQFNHKYFRTNFLLSGAQPYDEDNWKFIKIGENIFEIIRPCSRCIMTTNNPETGIRDSNLEPLATLRSYRQETDPEMRRVAGSAPRMGLQMILRSNNGGIVSVNDAIYVA